MWYNKAILGSANDMKKRFSLKKFLSRRLAGGVLLLSNISLISIGFSAWSIGGATAGEAQINVSAADLIEANIFSDLKYVSFSLGKEGIVDDDIFSKTGSLIVSFNINNSYCQQLSYLDSNNYFKLSAKLGCTDDNFLCLISDVKCNVDGSSLSKDGSSSNPISHLVNLPLEKESNATKVELSYSFLESTQVGNAQISINDYFGKTPSLSFKAEAIKQ